MGFEFDEPEEQASPWLRNPGTYHFLIMAQETDPLNFEKTANIPGIKLSLGVIGGTDPTQIDKTWDVTLYKGTDQDSDKQRSLNNRRLNRLFLATCLKFEGQPGKKAVIGDTSLLVGRQFIAQVEQYTNASGKTKLSFTWDNIYHVDDPAVAAVPKNAEAISAIVPELRRDSASFAAAGPVATQSQTPSAASAATKHLKPSDLLTAAGSTGQRQRSDVSNI
jgi:hypothetical protein